jgi:hypothetical protein
MDWFVVKQRNSELPLSKRRSIFLRPVQLKHIIKVQIHVITTLLTDERTRANDNTLMMIVQTVNELGVNA